MTGAAMLQTPASEKARLSAIQSVNKSIASR
jgi:hypothetical protein